VRSRPASRPIASDANRLGGWALGAVFVLLLASASPATSFAADTKSSVDAADDIFWDAVKDSRTAAPFNIYLQNYPAGRHHLEAAKRVKELESPSPPAPTRDQSAVIPPPLATPEPPAPAPPPPAQALPPPAPAPPPPADVLSRARPEPQGKPARGSYFAKSAAMLREAPAPDAPIVRTVKETEELRIDRRTDDGKWFRVGGPRGGGWVEASTVTDAKTAEASAWSKVSDSQDEKKLKRFLEQFPRGAHASEAKEALEDMSDTPSPAPPPDTAGGGDHAGSADTNQPGATAALEEMLRQDVGPGPRDNRRAGVNAPKPADTPAGTSGSGTSVPHSSRPEGAPNAAPPSPSSGGDFMERYAAAARMLHDGKYDEARDALEALIVEFPNDPHVANVLYRLGDLYFARRDYARAIDELGLAQGLDPESPDAPTALLEIALATGYRGAKAEACSQLDSLTDDHGGEDDGLDRRIAKARKDFRCRR
jgi:TolA-binding protein